MGLAAGARLGPYAILGALGAGGMGQVYKARDTRLERTVALKIVSDTVAADPQFRDRFDREAKAIAALSHPNICTLHDVGREGGVDFLVMEYLEGESLEQRLARGALRFEQALTLAIQICGALDRAHRAGIVHRDLKPGNIFLAKSAVSGEPFAAKLLDFGLAKAMAPVVAGTGDTIPPAITAQGAILGTFQYMAPEQLEGHDADARSDIFAFGAVLYEMLTGVRAFQGRSQASLIAAILDQEPPAMPPLSGANLPGSALGAIDRVVRKCLAKDPDRRWQTAADLRDELQWVGQAKPSLPAGAPAAARAWGTKAVALVAGVIALSAAGISISWLGRPGAAPPAAVTRFTISRPAGTGASVFDSVAISHDGRRFVFQGVREDGVPLLFVRLRDQLEVTPIRGTERSGAFTVSPDGEFVAFVDSRQLKKVSLSGGPAIPIADVADGALGLTWGADDMIVFGSPAGLLRVPAAGGTPQTLTRIDEAKKEVGHFWPSLTPDGRALVFMASSGAFASYQVELLTLADGGRHHLTQGESARVSTNGYLLFTRSRSLWTAPLDLQSNTLRAEPVLIVEDVQTNLNGNAMFDVSREGTLVYETSGIRQANLRLSWVDRAGRSEAAVGQHVTGIYHLPPRLTPDGTRLAITEHPDGGEDRIFVYDLVRGNRTPLSMPGNANSRFPLWAPDGKRLTFGSQAAGSWDIYSVPAGGGVPEPLLVANGDQTPYSWSPDGQVLLFQQEIASQLDVWMLPQNGKPAPVVATPFSETQPSFSPDGRWIMYVSDESGRSDVYVQPYPGPGDKVRVTPNGGRDPVWHPNGRQLFYMSGNGSTLLSVPIETSPAFRVGTATPVDVPTLYTNDNLPPYEIVRDGSRLMVVEDLNPGARPLIVVENWFAELERRLPRR
jgi:Tol biopolymer transport system component